MFNIFAHIPHFLFVLQYVYFCFSLWFYGFMSDGMEFQTTNESLQICRTQGIN